jgi:ABC-type antimicrobial peptide transport system permease subunit
MVSGLWLALLIGMLSGILPALFAMRLKIVEALRRT